MGNLNYRDEDIISYNPTTNRWTLVFDGSDVDLGHQDADTVYFLPNGRLLLSVDGDFTLSHWGQVDDSDLLAFTLTSLDETASCTIRRYWTGKAAQNFDDAINGLRLGAFPPVTTTATVEAAGVEAIDVTWLS